MKWSHRFLWDIFSCKGSTRTVHRRFGWALADRAREKQRLSYRWNRSSPEIRRRITEWRWRVQSQVPSRSRCNHLQNDKIIARLFFPWTIPSKSELGGCFRTARRGFHGRNRQKCSRYHSKEFAGRIPVVPWSDTSDKACTRIFPGSVEAASSRSVIMFNSERL